MSRTWVVSDTHFLHRLMAELRGFSSVEEHDETLVENWNAQVGVHDRVYHVGDVCMARKALRILSLLHGRKVLIKGNHDIWKLSDYTEHFDDIRAYRVFNEHGLILSHIPIYPGERWKLNAHGHMHAHVIDDKRYVNVCVEHTKFAPILLDELIEKARAL